jgi:hypothetical protein
MRCIHAGSRWVAEIRLKIFEPACDGEFVVAVEEDNVGHEFIVVGVTPPLLLGYDSMNALTDGDNINDLHIAHIRFGGDIFLQPGSERTT